MSYESQQPQGPGPASKSNLQRILAFGQRLFYVGCALAATWMGQTQPEGPFKDIWEGLKTASPTLSMILLVLYLRSDAERREAQRQCSERTVEFINANNVAHAALEKVTTLHQSVQELSKAFTKLVANFTKLAAGKRRGRGR